MADTKRILIINCGSSSLKYEVYLMPEKKSLGKGLVERIGLDEGKITQKTDSGTYEKCVPIPNHAVAMELVKKAITHETLGMLQRIEMIDGVGHRVVHGGEDYAASVIINDDVVKAIEVNSELAPLHNPANLTGIREAIKMLPDAKQVAVFDTAFHQTMPASAYLYGIPRELYNKYKIRRYGFHGTSHRYVAGVAHTMLKRVPENTNMITCHLGNGASITALLHGESVDTS
ncbi:MAG: acetate kinase, partial [Candidatus Cloacimonetes bacterium]|nr:acetate kinase [Candidatus Cloacimonadota bacterium]